MTGATIGCNGRLTFEEDPDVCDALRSLPADEGIDILLNARIKQVSGKCGSLRQARSFAWISSEPNHGGSKR